MSIIRKSYTSAQKLKVINAAKINGICATAKAFNIDKSMVSRWISREKVIAASKKSTRKIGSGRTVTFPNEETAVNDYILSKRSQNLIVSYDDIKSKMLSLTLGSSFKASTSWLYGFMKRYRFSLRICTTTVKKNSSPTASLSREAKIQSFYDFVERTVKDWKDAGLSYDIWNMDETPVWLDMPPKTTVDVKGKKRIPQVTTDNTRKRITTTLACSVDTKVLPMIVASPSTSSKVECDAAGVHYHENGYMTGKLMLTWIEDYFIPSLKSSRNLLVFDSFSGHLTDDVLNLLKENNIRYAVIPGGCTSYLQPLDLAVNRSFKSKLRKFWSEWIASDNLEKTNSGNVKRVPIEIMKQWIHFSWDSIKFKVIQNGFRKAEIYS